MALWNQPNQEDVQEKVNDMTKLRQFTPAPPLPVGPAANPSTAILKEPTTKERGESVFGAGVTIEGKIEGDFNVRIAGKFKGDINIKGDLCVDKGAIVDAKINVANVTIGGAVDGNVNATAHVSLLADGQLVGDLKAATLTVAAGSRMRGQVEFGWNASESAKFTNGHVHVDIEKTDRLDKNLAVAAVG